MQVATKSYTAMQFEKYAREAMLPSRSPGWKESQEMDAAAKAKEAGVDSTAGDSDESQLPLKRAKGDEAPETKEVKTEEQPSRWKGTPLPELPAHCRTELSARFAVDIKGHTSYLTFARKIVRTPSPSEPPAK